MTYDRTAWDEIADMGNGIEGQHLKCAKGKWVLDDDEIETGDAGVKICVVMESAIVGEVKWHDHKIVERNIGRISDGFAPPRQITEGWNPYVAFQAVRADEANLGELVTFTSSSWGGKFAFQSLVNPYRLKQRSQFPVVILSTKERGDVNGNIDPVFRIVSWSDRGNFAELLPPPAAQTAAIAHSPKPEEGYRSAAIINDDVPFSWV